MQKENKTLAKECARFQVFVLRRKKKLTREKLGFKFTVGTDAKIGNFAALICFSFNFFLFFSHIPSNIRESRSTHLTNTETFLFRSLACQHVKFTQTLTQAFPPSFDKHANKNTRERDRERIERVYVGWAFSRHVVGVEFQTNVNFKRRQRTPM